MASLEAMKYPHLLHPTHTQFNFIVFFYYKKEDVAYNG